MIMVTYTNNKYCEILHTAADMLGSGKTL